MPFVRPVNTAERLAVGHPGLEAKLLSHNESATVFHATVADGGRAAGLHYHQRDQIYFQLNGTLTAQLGSETHRIGPNTLVFIPAGVPHCNWNEGPGDESHLEVFAPSVSIAAPLAYPVEGPTAVPTEWQTRQPVTIIRVDGDNSAETPAGHRQQKLIGPDISSAVAVDYAEGPSGAAWPNTRIHDVDKHFFVLQGCLDFEIALKSYLADAKTLVTVPAGVPYRFFNRTPDVAKFLEVTVGTRDAGHPDTRLVRLMPMTWD